MNTDDIVRRLKQREQDEKDQRIAEQAARIRNLLPSARQLLVTLRRDLPTLLKQADSALVLLVQEERREVGQFRKHWEVEERNWAGWCLTSWKLGDPDGRYADSDPALYLLSDGSLLVYAYARRLTPGRGGRGSQVPDDFVLDLVITELRFGGSKLDGLRGQVRQLYSVAGLPAPDVPQVPPSNNSIDRDQEELDVALRSLRIRPVTDQIGEHRFQLRRFGIPQYVYPNYSNPQKDWASRQ